MGFVQNPRGNAQQNCWAESQQHPTEGLEHLYDAVAGCCREWNRHPQLRQQIPEDKSQPVNKHVCFVFFFKFLQVGSTLTTGALEVL